MDSLTSSVQQYPLLSLLASFLTGLVIWGIVYAAGKGRERRALARREVTGGDLMTKLPPAKWLEGDESPTGRRVLDCRPIALGVHLATPSPTVMEKFVEVSHGDGSELDGRSPENAWIVEVDWVFDFDEAEAIAAGMCPQVTEDLWRIDCRQHRLYLRRSWTGHLVFMTNFERIPTAGGRVTRIWAPGIAPFRDQSPEYVAAYVRHLIDTHLLNVATPFPIPPDFPDDDQKIAALVFHSVGRRGWLAEYFEGSQN